jgi:PAS domain S-box-containing protein
MDEYRNRLAFIVQSSNDPIIGMDKDGFIIEWNSAAERLFGYSTTEILGQHATVIVPKEKMKERKNIFQMLHAGKNIVSFETQRKKKDGTNIDVALTISPVQDAKKVLLGYSAVVRDITQQKEELKQKNAFIGIASHELKTPITSLKAYTQLLQKRLAQANDEKNIRMINTINSQTDKVVHLINDLLQMSRLDSGKFTIQRKVFSLPELVEKVVHTIQDITPTHVITIDSTIQSPVYADESKIEEVLINLLTNAIKYSPAADKVLVHISQDARHAIVSIQDFGIGIDRNDQQHIFKRFYRSTGKEHMMISGFGLGLYIAAEIMKQHQCKIWVKSQVGKGSTFTFTIPLVKPN